MNILAWIVEDNNLPKQDTWGNLITILSTPYPSALFTVTNNNFPMYTEQTLIDVPSDPYPLALFTVSSLCNNGFPMFANKYLIDIPAHPYPSSIFITDNNNTPVYYNHNQINLGACNSCNNLSSVIISQTVKHIGSLAFANTSIAEVTISNDCDYEETSFPNDCIINKI